MGAAFSDNEDVGGELFRKTCSLCLYWACVVLVVDPVSFVFLTSGGAWLWFRSF